MNEWCKLCKHGLENGLVLSTRWRSMVPFPTVFSMLENSWNWKQRIVGTGQNLPGKFFEDPWPDITPPSLYVSQNCYRPLFSFVLNKRVFDLWEINSLAILSVHKACGFDFLTFVQNLGIAKNARLGSIESLRILITSCVIGWECDAITQPTWLRSDYYDGIGSNMSRGLVELEAKYRNEVQWWRA